jgi:hypothetical protein
MLAQEFFVDIDTGAVTGGATITGLPGLVGIMGAALNLKVAFKTAGVVGPLASYDYAKLVLKGDLDHDDEPVFFADAPALSGTETATRYTFAALCDSLEMRALVEGKNELVVKGQIEVKLTAEVEPRVSRPFDVQLINCYSRSTDGAPSAADEAAWAWLKARLAEGDNIQFAYNEETRVLTIAADLSGIEVEGVLDLKGDINATANPNYPVAEKGDCYHPCGEGWRRLRQGCGCR